MPANDRDELSPSDILLADYLARCQDEQTFVALLGQLAGVGIAVQGGVLALAAFCRGGCGVAAILFAVLPLAPLGIVAYMAFASAVSRFRNEYMRVLERQLRGLVGKPIPLSPGSPDGPAIFAPQWQGIMEPLAAGAKRVRAPFLLLALSNVVFYVLYLVVTSAALLVTKNLLIEVVGGVIYGAAVIALLWVAFRWTGPDSQKRFRDVLASTEAAKEIENLRKKPD
jgi:hypothetical protein